MSLNQVEPGGLRGARPGAVVAGSPVSPLWRFRGSSVAPPGRCRFAPAPVARVVLFGCGGRASRRCARSSLSLRPVDSPRAKARRVKGAAEHAPLGVPVQPSPQGRRHPGPLPARGVAGGQWYSGPRRGAGVSALRTFGLREPAPGCASGRCAPGPCAAACKIRRSRFAPAGRGLAPGVSAPTGRAVCRALLSSCPLRALRGPLSAGRAVLFWCGAHP